MKTLFVCLLLAFAVKCQAGILIIPVSSFPNTSTYGSNYLMFLSVPGNTNYNMTMAEFVVALTKDTNFITAFNASLSFTANGSGPGTNFIRTSLSGPYVSWTNTTAYWGTNASFTLTNLYSAGQPYNNAHTVLSNSNPSTTITVTLPFQMYSLSLGTNVTTATIQTNSVLDLQFDYTPVAGYFVRDYSKNSAALSTLGTYSGTAHGIVVWTNGTFELH